MPAKIEWTPDQDVLLRQLRFDHKDWIEIEMILGRPISSCMDRSRQIGARPSEILRPTSPVVTDISDERQPLGCGHVVTWNTINQDTVLEGAVYPTGDQVIMAVNRHAQPYVPTSLPNGLAKDNLTGLRWSDKAIRTLQAIANGTVSPYSTVDDVQLLERVTRDEHATFYHLTHEARTRMSEAGALPWRT